MDTTGAVLGTPTTAPKSAQKALPVRLLDGGRDGSVGHDTLDISVKVIVGSSDWLESVQEQGIRGAWCVASSARGGGGRVSTVLSRVSFWYKQVETTVRLQTTSATAA